MVLPILLSTIILPPVVSATQTDADAAISSAKNLLLSCYNAAREAESAGANITVLQNTLDTAGTMLSRAELAYSNSDYDAAVNYANQCTNSLNHFTAEANDLAATGTQQRNQVFLITVVGPIAGTFALVGAGFAVWFLLKKKYAT